MKKILFYLILSYYETDIFNIYFKFLKGISQAAINFKITTALSKWDMYTIY